MNPIPQPDFSILIPYHNGQATIAETIASIENQSGISYEIIVADDRSSSSARKYLETLQKSTRQLKIIDATGTGPSAARNSAALQAKGQIFCFLDADDCLKENALNSFKILLDKNPKTGVCFGRVRIAKNPGHIGGIITPHCASPRLAQIIGENRICTASNIIVRKEAFFDIGSFNEKMTHAEDQEWLGRAFLFPRWTIEGLDMITLDYRTSIGGLSTNLKKMENGWRVLIKELSISQKNLDSSALSEAKALFYRYLARRSLRLGLSRTEAAYFILIAIGASIRTPWSEVKRTTITTLASFAVFIVGIRPFRKFVT